ncbi:hypothetical protein Bpfe_021544 [Biomphalaria pfeifferi]|uniref:Uncharacterized protein n=1 Tax=Biomphalaria pfeifferi TaxID=112525 RepID=A0AAD8B6Q5_BIOPF|nr:hypothetical protein Bpfe_021544 [Biomphalaria pfeifferi]
MHSLKVSSPDSDTEQYRLPSACSCSGLRLGHEDLNNTSGDEDCCGSGYSRDTSYSRDISYSRDTSITNISKTSDYYRWTSCQPLSTETKFWVPNLGF